MSKIFVSYRRADSGPAVDSLVLELQRAFGRRNVFHDLESIKPGAKFPEVIRRALVRSDAVVVVIGPNYFDEKNGSRLLDPLDPVRMELELTAAHDIYMQPVTVGGASMPSKMQVPPTLAILAETNAVEIQQGKSFQQNIGELISTLKGRTRPLKIKRFLKVAAFAASCLISVAGGVLTGMRYGPVREVQVPVPGRQPPSPGTAEDVRKSRRADKLIVRAEAKDKSGKLISGGQQGVYSIWIEGPKEILNEITSIKYVFYSSDPPGETVFFREYKNARKNSEDLKASFTGSACATYMITVIEYSDKTFDVLPFYMRRTVTEAARKARS